MQIATPPQTRLKQALSILLVILSAATARASLVVGSWTPIFQGVDHLVATNVPDADHPRLQVVHGLRVDLTDPDLHLFTTPRCTNNCGNETIGTTTSLFLEGHHLQVAVNGNFFAPADQPVGTPETVYGLAISQGKTVSLQDSADHAAAFLFTTNNHATFIPTNWPPTNTAGIYTAFAGNFALVVKGKNIGNASTLPQNIDPRTAAGLSQDRRYLYLITIDGRQPGYSDSANFFETGEWLIQLGAYDGFNLDGGGSATMVMSDCAGKAIRLNKPSYVAATGHERTVGHNIGIYAKPAQGVLRDVTVQPGDTTAIVTWRTETPATTQVEYGLTSGYGSVTPLEETPVTFHVATLSGLSPVETYFYRGISRVGNEEFSSGCLFATTNSLTSVSLFGMTNAWKYTPTNMDGINWTARGYAEPGWLGPGPALLYVESSATVGPKNTPLPTLLPVGQTTPIPTAYYFRTRFQFSGEPPATSLTLSNYIDDGAVFYLNGVEIARLRMRDTPTVITNASLATGFPCTVATQDANLTCPDVFTVDGAAVANLVQGENVMAVEVHNYTKNSPDIVFGTSLSYNRTTPTVPQLHILYSGNEATLYWNGSGFAVQSTTDLSSVQAWSDVPGPITISPVRIQNARTTFYRLRK